MCKNQNMANMKVTGIALMVCLLAAQSSTFPDVSAIVNGPGTLPCTCSGQMINWTIFYPIKAHIAGCHRGMCEIDQRFQNRFSFLGNTSSGNFSMSTSSVLYNDLGIYRCTCNGKPVSEGKLHVYDPRIVTVFEGENITLPCYGDTRRDAKDVQWKKDGENLLKYESHTKSDEASAGRFSLSKQRFQNGDLSLNINSVTLSDAGLYLCLIHDESRDGDPRAVVLTVEKRQPEQQSPTTPNSCGIYLGSTVVLALALVLAVIIGAIAYFYTNHTNKRPQDETPTSLSNPVQEECPMMPKLSSTQPIQN